MLGINIKSLMEQFEGMLRWNRQSVAKGSPIKHNRSNATHGKHAKAVAKRRRLRDIAYESRRQNRKVM